mgnify:CR=1 FL=1
MTIRVGGVPEHVSLPWLLAIERGRLDPAVTWTDQPGGTGQMVRALADDELDAAVALTEGLVAAIAAGLDAHLVSAYTASPMYWGVHAAGASTLELDGLDGARFAVSRLGSGSHLMAYVLAEDLGLSLGDDSFVVVGGIDGARAALAAGDAEVFLWDRFMTSPVVDSGEFRRLGVVPTPWPAFTVAARGRAAAQDRSLGQALAVVGDVGRGLHDDPATIGRLVDRYELDPDDARHWLEVTEFAEPARPDPDMIEAVERRLVALGLVEHLRGAAFYLGSPG